jgi:hypothetical protein
MAVLIETYQGRTAAYGLTDQPVSLEYDQHKFVNRANAVSLAQSHPETWRIPGYVVSEKKQMSWFTQFLSIGKTVLHVVEMADQLAAPIVAVALGGTDGPIIAGMMLQGNAAAVGIEAISATLTTPMNGEQKGAVVDAGTQATFSLINSIRASQGQPPLAATIPAVVATSVKTVVEGLKTVGAAVGPVAQVTPVVATTGNAAFSANTITLHPGGAANG